VLDEGVHVAQAHGQRAQLHAVHHDAAGLAPALDQEADHAAESALLPPGQLVLGVRAQAGVDDFGHLGVVAQEVGELQGAFAVAVHAHRQGLESAQQQPGVER